MDPYGTGSVFLHFREMETMDVDLELLRGQDMYSLHYA